MISARRDDAMKLHGLILVGGASRRMGRPKWAIEYAGRPQVEVVADLLRPRCEQVYLSVKEPMDGLPDLPVILDAFPYRSPSSGILSAMRARPGAAWLVVACDLPFLDGGTLDHLLAAREPGRVATAYRSAYDGLPEPLCTVWEARASAPLRDAAGDGRPCPRRFLIDSDPALLDLVNLRALDNVNTPDEYEEALALLQPN